DELLQRVGNRRRKSRQVLLRGWRLPALALGLRPGALQIEEPRLSQRALLRFCGHEIEPVALERGAGETAHDEMRMAGRAALTRRVIDPQARSGERPRAAAGL